MMTPKEAMEAWNTVIDTYKETVMQNNPEVTVTEIVKRLGKEKTNEIFATIAMIKKHDGRISLRNRDKLRSISVNPDCLVRDRFENPLLTCALDYIHTAHIDNMISRLEV